MDNKYALTFVYKKKWRSKCKSSKKRRKRKKEIRLKAENKAKEEEEEEEIHASPITRSRYKIIEASTGLSKQWIGRLKSGLKTPKKRPKIL